jgi:probable rRNA maturation factor
MIEVAFEGISASKQIQELIIDASQAVLTLLEKNANLDVSFVIGTDEFLKKLNLKYKGEDKPTDVLSFANEDQQMETQHEYLGDIAISLERADAQAKIGGHSVYGELQLLSVHGMLHLLGYDHALKNEKQKMWDIQNSVLNSLGVEVDQKRIGK